MLGTAPSCGQSPLGYASAPTGAVCLIRLTAHILIAQLGMCLTTRRDKILGMEELIEKLREASYYIPGKWFQDKEQLDAYVQGLKAGREQALRILGGGPSQP